MLAGALCRLAADVPRTSPHDMPQLARHLGRTLLARNAREAPAAHALSRAYACALYSRRAYATTTRAIKPTATVKKAVKSAAAEKPPPKKAATAKKKTAQKTAAKTTKKTAAKKPAAKKAAPKRRKKKELSDEQKEKLKIRELRAKALREPVSQRTLSAYNAFVSEYAVGKSDGTTQAAKIADASNQFKALTPAQLEHYNHLAKQMTIARKAEFDAWIKSYTPEQIRIANRARFMLRRMLGNKQKSAPAYTTKLHDDRHVKTAPNPYVLFFKERHASGDLKNIRSSEASKLIANEWKALSESEKKKYEEEYEATKQRASTA